jgi:hypothetical protein
VPSAHKKSGLNFFGNVDKDLIYLKQKALSDSDKLSGLKGLNKLNYGSYLLSHIVV